MSKNFWRMAALAATVPFLQAQQGDINGPITGYVFDRPARVLRPVLGIPGASVLGDPVNFGFEVAAAYVSPRQDAAVVVGADRSLHFFRVSAGKATEVTANGISGTPDGVAFSPSGTAAALYAAGRVQVVTGLPDKPAPAGVVDARAGQEQTALTVRPHPHRGMATEMFAVSDDGALLLVASEGTIRVLQSAGGEAAPLDWAGTALAAFAPNGHDVIVASPGSGNLTLVKDAGGAAQQQAIASGDLSGAVGVGFSADGKRVYVARSGGSVAVFDVQSKTRSDVSCNCVPFGLTSMGGVFRLNEAGAGPVWLLDPAEPRIVFVPAKSSM